MISHRVIISGRVQGVGYRDWMVAQASTLGVHGWVRNRGDGSVEALVHGAADALEELLRRCHRGPHAASVIDIARHPADAPAGPGFSRAPTA